MAGLRAWIAAVGCALTLGACEAPPPSYRVVTLEEARLLVRNPELALIDAVAEGADAAERAGLRWEVGEGVLRLPPGLDTARSVLIIAPSERVAHRSAAALARGGARGVAVCIARNAEERSSLYAHAPPTQEVGRGRDS